VLEGLATRADATGDLPAAVAWTRRRVQLDPLAEDAQRALMRRLGASGDTVGAVVAYAKLRERLRREVGISPSAQTRGVILGLRSQAEPDGAHALGPAVGRAVGLEASEHATGGTWRPGEPFPLPPRLRRAIAGPFVGRAAELAWLAERWSQTVSGNGAGLVVLGGDPGIGKTRLSRELALRAQREGALVLQGSAREDVLVPHEPFVEALGHYLRVAAPDERAQRLTGRARDLEPLLPQVGSALDDGPAADRDRRRNRRYLMFEAVASLLEELGSEVPVLLSLEDLHWADASTASLLCHLLETRPDARLLVVATLRPADLPSRGELAEGLARLRRDGLLAELHLTGLAETDVADLARALRSDPLPHDVLTALHQEADGNPFFVQEVLRQLGPDASVRTLAELGVPDGVRAVVASHLARLDTICIRLLTVAAVVGREFELAVLEQVSDLTSEAIAEALDAAVTTALVVELPCNGDRFAFSHALVRRALAERLTRAHRRRIHARVGEALEQHYGADGDALPEIAYHLCEAAAAGNPERAVQFATRAAERAMAGLAYAEAGELFTHAVSLLPADDLRRQPLAIRCVLAYTALAAAVSHRSPSGEAVRQISITAPSPRAWTTSTWRPAGS
jgi:hypothetical protein